MLTRGPLVRMKSDQANFETDDGHMKLVLLQTGILIFAKRKEAKVIDLNSVIQIYVNSGIKHKR